MKDLNDYTVGAYQSFSLLLVYLPLAVFSSEGLSILQHFESLDYLLIGLLGLLGCYSKIFKFKALQYEEPGKLGGVSYMQNIIQFMMDLVFLHIAFTYMQLFGVFLVLAINAVKFYGYIGKVRTQRKESLSPIQSNV